MNERMTTELLIEVPFYDLDPMNIVWHGNYLKYFERVRCKLLDQFDFGYLEMEKTGYFWPIVDIRLKYVNSASFGQILRCTGSIVEYINCLKITYNICCAETGERLTKGYSVQVAVDQKTQEMQYASPQILLQKLGIADEGR